jgi:hypothetical protein
MNKEQLAEQLDGTEYPLRLDEDTAQAAKDNGLLIVYGASDDLIEFDGVFQDEAGAWDGGTFYFDKQGLFPDFENINRDDKDALRSYFAREAEAKNNSIEAIWDDKEKNCSFWYKTDIPHAVFKVVEDEGVYCYGIVIDIKDLK